VAEIKDYEDVAGYPVSDEVREEMFSLQTECAVVWSTKEGWPVGVMHRFVWHDAAVWVTCAAHRKRVPALRRDPRGCVIVSSEGTSLGPDKTVTMKTLATVHDDRDVKDWFYPALATKLTRGHPEATEGFRQMLDSPNRVVIELRPVKFISYDGALLQAAIARSRRGGAA
jgi:general stress protein 26